MAECQHCSHQLKTGELICPKCKHIVLPPYLLGTETKSITLSDEINVEIDVHTNAILNKYGLVLFSGDTAELNIVQSRGYIGRDDGNNIDTSELVVYINLSAHGAQLYGISRLHARLDRSKDDVYTIIDLGSTNGTQVNGTRLKPFQPYELNEHDVILLGKFSVEVRYFAYTPAGT